MSILRSPRAAAVALLMAAILALVLANSPVGPALFAVQDLHVGIPGTPLYLSTGHWVSDGLLAVFFFVAAIELKHELADGQLNTLAKAAKPAIAAAGGVVLPIAIYLAVTTGSGYESGWPVPTATDIAFALGILAVFGHGLPGRLRVFLLALAILDDIVGIAFIAVLFTDDPDILALLCAAIGVAVFALLSRHLDGRKRAPIGAAMILVGLVVWGFVLASGVHPTIAGVALGLAMHRPPAASVRHALEPVTNGFILPLFAFSAALVVIPHLGIRDFAAPFWGITLALPIGKLLGIVAGGWLADRLDRSGHPPLLTFGGLVTAGALGGIGFTVSLLMNELAFHAAPEIADEGTLAVLLGSTISIITASILVSWQARYFRRLRRLREHVTARRDLA
ncbi:Na+/H+ antiporter NhaA [Agromyces sp. Marseille-Q5079]|uniref:Na+/H+ antiporter NhaA n=1 Tax=Agromyces sp. Marseille-Q5079 TaxID=3439059 RepID=UPI003D9C9CE4